MKEVGRKIAALLYPPRCVICDAIVSGSNSHCCSACQEKLPMILEAYCMNCGKRLDAAEKEYCSQCQKIHFYYDQGIAPFAYDGVIRDAVFRMKYANRRDYVPYFAAMMAERIQVRQSVWQIDYIISIPMHHRKLTKRGYNQAELLAEVLSERMNIPCKNNLVYCTRLNREQKRLNGSMRRFNLKNVFRVRNNTELCGKNILIIDDVYTTGSTVNEMAYILKRAGASKVFFAVLCIVS